jgi:hypothetical protein
VLPVPAVVFIDVSPALKSAGEDTAFHRRGGGSTDPPPQG